MTAAPGRVKETTPGRPPRDYNSPSMRGGGRGALAGWATLGLLATLGLAGAAAHPEGLLLGLPTTRDLTVVALGLLPLLVLARDGSGAKASVGLLPVAALAAVGLDLPGLRALTGAPLLALVFAGAAVALAAAGRRPPRYLFLPVVFAVYAWGAARVQLEVGPQGDEPHYLMVADSLLLDGDLRLERDYAAGRYSAYADGPLSPHYRVRGREGEIYSLHAVGLSLLILPAQALGGYPAVSFFMALLAALLAREVRELLRESLADESVAEGFAWTAALSPPLLSYAGLVFTEVPAALAVVLVIRHGRAPDLAVPKCIALGAALAFLPWLNVRYVPLAVVLAAYLLVGRPRARAAIAWLAPGLASAVALAAYHHALYGFWDPRRVYGRRPEWSVGGVPEGLQGLLLDQEFGLLAYAPVYALAVPGLVSLLRRERRLAVTAVALGATTLLTAAAWPMWRGGFNPPARFLVPVVPAFALGAAAWLRKGLGGGAALLVGWGLFTGVAGFAHPDVVHRDRQGSAPLFREWSGAEEWTRLLPAYVLADQEPDRRRLAMVWAGALALACARWPWRPPRWLGLAGATSGLAVAATLASSAAARRTEGRDAVRVLGRAAVLAPRLAWRPHPSARWGPDDLVWGPVYEPHRHPSGAVLGDRLVLAPGEYRLRLDVEEPSGDSPPPWIEVAPVGASARAVRLDRDGGRLAARFDVRPRERAVTLRVRGGGPFRLRAVEVETAQPFPSPAV
jgi:hypothetical protein